MMLKKTCPFRYCHVISGQCHINQIDSTLERGTKTQKKLKLGTKMLVFKIGGSKLPFYEKRGPKVHLSQFTF